MNNIAGYLIKKEDGLFGSRGRGFDYILAGNGLFVEASNSLLSARVMIAGPEVRGLPGLQPGISLKFEPVPSRMFDLALSVMIAGTMRDDYDEKYFAVIRFKDRYEILQPPQKGGSGKVRYECPDDDIILELHSHGKMPAWFSPQDDRDEQALRIYGVVGRLDEPVPEVRFRVGIYGYWNDIAPGDIFDFPLTGIKQARKIFEDEEKESDEIHAEQAV